MEKLNELIAQAEKMADNRSLWPGHAEYHYWLGRLEGLKAAKAALESATPI